MIWEGTIQAIKDHIIDKLNDLPVLKEVNGYPNSDPVGLTQATVIYTGSSPIPQMTNTTNTRVFTYRVGVVVPIEAQTYNAQTAENLSIELSEKILTQLDSALEYGGVADLWAVAQSEIANQTTDAGHSLFLQFTVEARKEATVRFS